MQSRRGLCCMFITILACMVMSATSFVVGRSPVDVPSRALASAVIKEEPEEQNDSSSAAATATVLTGNLTILEQADQYLVVDKPPSVVCHHSDWTGSKSRRQFEVPMLQRTRQALKGRRVNLVHRLDRGCSGCLLMTYAENADDASTDTGSTSGSSSSAGATAQLSRVLQARNANKTYIALVRGEGILQGRNFQEEGWFLVDRPIKDEKGVLNSASTWFRFVAGQDNDGGKNPEQARASLVLARPQTGRWHQIRRHLNGLSHPILGDSSHGNSRVNREWRKERGLLPERTCLHLAHLQLPPVEGVCPEGINVHAPLPQDMLQLLQTHLPRVLEKALPILQDEGVEIFPRDDNRHVTLPYSLTVHAE